MNRPSSPRRASCLVLVLAACGGGAPSPAPQAAVPRSTMTTPPKPERPSPRHGELVAYKAAHDLGRETWEDDGDTRTSRITFAGRSVVVKLARGARRVVVESGGEATVRALPEGGFALENGSFQAYADVAAAVPPDGALHDVKVLLPSSGAVVDARARVTEAVRDGKAVRNVTLAIGPTTVEAVVDAEGRVVAAAVPAQAIDVRRPEDGPPPPPAARPVPAGLHEEAFAATRGTVTLRGTLWTPEGKAAPPPLVVFVAGSGPTDRDGNSALGLRTDAYRMLAEALGKQGIATLRYDKRGTGESSTSFDATRTTIDDFVADAGAVVAEARAKKAFGRITMLGHSEGGLVALLLASEAKDAREKPDALVLLATAGRPFDVLLREQLASKLGAEDRAAADQVLAALRAGKSPDDVPASLAPIFPKATHAFFTSVLARDPVAALRKTRVPVAVVQGESDAQVTVADARLLAGAKAGATLTIVPRMSHVLKDEPSRALPQASYTDPSKPLSHGVVEAVALGVAREVAR